MEGCQYTSVGGYWNRKGDVEIDIVVRNDVTRTVDPMEIGRNPRKPDMGVPEEEG